MIMRFKFSFFYSYLCRYLWLFFIVIPSFLYAFTTPDGDLALGTHAVEPQNVSFKDGVVAMRLDLDGFVDDISLFSTISDPHFKVTIAELDEDLDLSELFVVFPIPATPYAIQSRISEKVHTIDPGVIEGVFTQSFVMVSGNFLVTSNTSRHPSFIVTNNKIGVGKMPNANLDYVLDVSGNLNASDIYINGEEIATVVSPWTRDGDRVFISEKDVGIGVTTDNMLGAALTVSGNVNATSYSIQGTTLLDRMYQHGFYTWQPITEKLFEGIYILNNNPKSFRVGINVSTNAISDITETLVGLVFKLLMDL